LWLRHKDSLFRICLQFTHQARSDAEDVLSGVMLKAFDKMALHADRIQNVGAWLCRLTRNYCIDLRRKHRREMLALCELQYVRSAGGASDSAAEPEANPAPCCCLTVDAAISALPHGQREVITLRFFGKKNYEEIAAQLNLSAAAVRKRVQRAREELRRMGMTEILMSEFTGADKLQGIQPSAESAFPEVGAAISYSAGVPPPIDLERVPQNRPSPLRRRSGPTRHNRSQIFVPSSIEVHYKI
jgi:RNA polymerase sigma factor (sigma-70 family)